MENSLITNGIPSNFPTNKEGMKKYYTELWQAFPDANFEFEHVIVEGNEAACMFSMTGISEQNFWVYPLVTSRSKLTI